MRAVDLRGFDEADADSCRTKFLRERAGEADAIRRKFLAEHGLTEADVSWEPE